MSTVYKNSSDVPLDTIANRLRELADAILGGRSTQANEFTMRIPAECDRDADIVIAEAAKRLGDLRDYNAQLQDELAGARDEAEKLRGQVINLPACQYHGHNHDDCEKYSGKLVCDVDLLHPDSQAWLLRKEAEAVEAIKPTAEMKAEMLGSFKLTEELTCSACYFDEPDNDCEVCAGDVTYAQDFQIPWTSQKQIIGTAVAHVAQRLRNHADELEGKS